MERKLIPFPSGFAQRRRREEREFLPAALEIIDTPVSPAGRIMMAVVVVLVIAAVVWAYIGQLDIVATATGRLIPSGQIKVIQPLESGVIKQILVTDGDHVGAGDVLIELDTTAEAADRDRIARDIVQAQLDIARLRAALLGDIGAFAPAEGVDPALADAERRQLAAQIAQHRAKTDGLEQQIAAKTADRDEAKAKIAKIDASLPLLEAKVGIYEQLRQNQLTSKIAWLDSERQLSEAKHDRVVALYQLQGSEAQIASLGQQRQEVEADFRRQTLDQLAKVTQYAAEQQKELIKAARRTGLQEIRAPVSGTVEQLAVHTIGGVVRPAQSLMVVVPDDSKLELEAMLPNRDAGFVHAGQPAELKVEAFNYTRYGLLHGTVRRISRDALRDERDAPNLDENEPANSSPAQHSRVQAPAYIARIALAESAVETEQGSIPLEPGMAVTAEIKTGQRPVIAYLLSPFTRYRHDALKER